MRRILFVVLMLLPVLAHAQGEDVSLINPDAVADYGDYATLVLWDAAKATDATAANLIYVAEGICTSGTPATDVFILSNAWVTDATRYVKIWTNPDSTYRHDGTYPAGNVYRREANSGIQLRNYRVSYLYVIGIAFKMRDADFSDCVQIALDGGVPDGANYIEECIFDGNDADLSNGNNATIRLQEFGHALTVTNTIIYDTDTAFLNADGAFTTYNCTAQNCDLGYNAVSLIRNCIAQDCTDGYFGGGGGATSNNCSDIVADAPGANPQTGEVLFADEGANDFHLGDGDTVARGNGFDLSGIFTIDIDGDTRDAWDIGADEFVAAAAGLGQFIIIGN